MPVDADRLRRCYATARDALLAERNDAGYWEGELSTSALSTATAVMALELVRRHRVASIGRKPAEGVHEEFAFDCERDHRADAQCSPLDALIDNGIAWLADHQNDDGGWGDTTKSISNISTTMLCRASFHATWGTRSASRPQSDDQFAETVSKADAYIEKTGGVDAVLKRYGNDRTFSIPILTHCALAGLVDWKHVLPLPFYLACLPPRFYKTVRLPVVSYAFPALIAIGQVGYHFRKPWNPISRFFKWLSINPTLRRLESIQPENGGFLEATPLTSFVTMSLAGMGRADHPVAKKGVQFIAGSVRPDGSWPIDTNLATWVTTLSVNALGDDLPEVARPTIRDWLLNQQYKEIHPYTNADPGGWAWTDLPGGVPDADDTPGAMLALMELEASHERSTSRERKRTEVQKSEVGSRTSEKIQADGLPSEKTSEAGEPNTDSVLSTQYPVRSTEQDPHNPTRFALDAATRWLLGLQNRDGGFPTFCRGWGKLPFDRSSADISAHCLRALKLFGLQMFGDSFSTKRLVTKFPRSARPLYIPMLRSIKRGFHFLEKAQRPDGSWLPLWFGNQHAPNDENSTYGTARVLAAYRDCDRLGTSVAQWGLEWLRTNQNDDGGWGGVKGTRSSVEETALAIEILLSDDPQSAIVRRGLQWLCDRVEDGTWREPTPIGFYFARLWYFERLYPLIFTVAALRRACRELADRTDFNDTNPSEPTKRSDGGIE